MQVTWIGISGKAYSYELVPLHAAAPPPSKGNYIFSNERPEPKEAVYVGEGHLPDRYAAALKEGCIILRGATHYSYHTRNAHDEAARKKEELDIIDGNPECLAPTGCNGQGP